MSVIFPQLKEKKLCFECRINTCKACGPLSLERGFTVNVESGSGAGEKQESENA